MTPPEQLQIRIHGDAALPTLIYLPGLHGDWTLIPSFRAAVAGRARFVEFTYPRTTEWTLEDYAAAIEGALVANGITSGWLLAESFGSQPGWAIVGRAREEGRGEKADGSHLVPPHEPEVWCPPFRVSETGNTLKRGHQTEGAAHDPDARPMLEVESLHEPERLLSPSLSSIWNGGEGARRAGEEVSFQPVGLILAGGFVRHPADWMVRLTRRIFGRMPLRWITRLLFGYAKFARFRHRHAPETLAHIDEFIARRTEADRAAAVHRLDLILGNDLRSIAVTTTVPVFALTGLVDPVVPWPWTFRWLRRHCPALRATRIIAGADHNVLSTAPAEAARQVLEWVARGA
jgi:pimeloyl-ACP methyl ester carboxylesterase